MGMQVCMNGVMMCTFGMAPSSIVPTPKPIMTSNMVAANIMDHIPLANIPPFGACMSLSNPTVAAATAAALGVLTPMPCIPITPAPWVPGSPTVILQNFPALNETSKLTCIWGGVISITFSGQATHFIP